MTGTAPAVGLPPECQHPGGCAYGPDGGPAPRCANFGLCRRHAGLPEVAPVPRCVAPLRCYCAVHAPLLGRPSTAGTGATDLRTTRRLAGQAQTVANRPQVPQNGPLTGWRSGVGTGGPAGRTPPSERRPAARASAPQPSHDAANRIAGPPIGRLRMIVFAALASQGTATDDRLEQLTGRSHQSVSSARNWLVSAGYVADTGRLAATRTGHRATVWGIAPQAEEAARTALAQGTML